jgi:hypothetical protein
MRKSWFLNLLGLLEIFFVGRGLVIGFLATIPSDGELLIPDSFTADLMRGLIKGCELVLGYWPALLVKYFINH